MNTKVLTAIDLTLIISIVLTTTILIWNSKQNPKIPIDAKVIAVRYQIIAGQPDMVTIKFTLHYDTPKIAMLYDINVSIQYYTNASEWKTKLHYYVSIKYNETKNESGGLSLDFVSGNPYFKQDNEWHYEPEPNIKIEAYGFAKMKES